MQIASGRALNPPAEEPRMANRHWTFWVFCAFALVGAYYLFTAHLNHVFDALPYLLLMACPLMHLFHGHGRRHGSDPGSSPVRHDASARDHSRQDNGS